MKLVMLLVLFSTEAQPAPHQEPGFGPRAASSMEQCLMRRRYLQNHLEGIAGDGVAYKVFCVEFQALGYDEALAAFRRELGDPA